MLPTGSTAQAPASASDSYAPLADRAAGSHDAGSRYVHGNERTAGWHLITQIECPRGHHIKDGFIQLGHTALRCKCGVMLWVLVAVHSHLAFVAEVDIEDVRRIKAFTSGNALLEVLDYLGERTGNGRAA